jgi:hypothetical protein
MKMKINIKINPVHKRYVVVTFDTLIELIDEEIEFWNEKVDYEANYENDKKKEVERLMMIGIMEHLKKINKMIDKILMDELKVNEVNLNDEMAHFESKQQLLREMYDDGKFTDSQYVFSTLEDLQYVNFNNIFEEEAN